MRDIQRWGQLSFCGGMGADSCWRIGEGLARTECWHRSGALHCQETTGGTAQPVFGEMTQKNPEFGVIHEVERYRASHPAGGVVDFDDSAPIQTVSTGLPYTIVPLRSLQKLEKLRLDLDGAAEYLARSGGKFFYFVCRETVDPKARLHARMIFYNGDDPATGSAAGCCAAWMVAHGIAANEEQVLIEQGLEMHRPSRIFVRAKKQDNQVVNVRVGGNCVEVLRGEVTIPL